MSRPFQQLTRRAFLRNGALVMLAAAAGKPGELAFAGAVEPSDPLLRIGLLTDLHYADKPPAGTRFYRETLTKIRECVARLNEVRPDFTVEVGDLIDAAETAEGEVGYLKAIEAEYAKLKGERHYVLGNHCVWTLTKSEFLKNCGAKEEFYAFDRGEFHFAILDACYRADGVPYGQRNFVWSDSEIPPPERDWLKNNLGATAKKTIIFVHQRLDVQNNYGIKSAPEVRKILEGSGKVMAVFQGHSHKNDYQEINGIHYCTLAAMVEDSGVDNNAYALLSVFKDGSLKVEGFRQQKGYQFPARA